MFANVGDEAEETLDRSATSLFGHQRFAGFSEYRKITVVHVFDQVLDAFPDALDLVVREAELERLTLVTHPVARAEVLPGRDVPVDALVVELDVTKQEPFGLENLGHACPFRSIVGKPGDCRRRRLRTMPQRAAWPEFIVLLLPGLDQQLCRRERAEEFPDQRLVLVLVFELSL